MCAVKLFKQRTLFILKEYHDHSHLIDIISTCVELGKASYPKEYKGQDITPMEGISLAPILKVKAKKVLTFSGKM